MSTEVQKMQIRNLVDGYYDIQKLRIATGNRVVASLRPTAIANLTESSDEQDKEKAAKQAEKALSEIVKEYKNITDYFVTQFNGRGSVVKAIDPNSATYIKTKVDYELVSAYMGLVSTEDSMFKSVSAIVKTHPLWDKFFEGVSGCGPLMAAVCIAYLDPYKARHCSSFWKYCGLDVVYVPDKDAWEGRSRWHVEDIEYVDKDGNPAKRRGLTYNPAVKSRLVFVMGGSLLKAGVRSVKDGDGKRTGESLGISKYGKIYLDYKHRLQCRPDMKDAPDWRFHKMANRYMVKMFLRDLWVCWREMEGLEVDQPYEVAKLGMRPHGI